MLRTGRIRGDERQIDLSLRRRRQFDLGLFSGLFQALQGKLVVAQIDALLFLEFVGQIADKAHVEVFTAKERVAVGGLHLEHAVADFQDRHVERAAAEIVHRDGALLGLVETIGQRSRRRLVDDAQHFKAGDLAGVLGGLTLGVVEIGRNGDDRLIDLLAEMGFRGLFHLLQDESGDLRGRVGLAVGLDPGVAVGSLYDFVGDKLLVLFDRRIVVTAANEALDGEDGLFRICHCLALGRLTDEALAIVSEGDDGRGRPHALGILDHFRRFAVHHGDARIRGAEIDPNDLSHGPLVLLFAAGWLGPDGAPIQTPSIKFSRRRDAPPHIGGGPGPARTSPCKQPGKWNFRASRPPPGTASNASICNDSALDLLARRRNSWASHRRARPAPCPTIERPQYDISQVS